MTWKQETGEFKLGDFSAEKGGTIDDAKLVWQSHGTLNAARDNVILYPSAIARSTGHVLAHRRRTGSSTRPAGSSSSQTCSRTGCRRARPRRRTIRARHPRRQRARAAPAADRAFRREAPPAVYGFSMGAMQAYHWAALYPEMVERAIVVCGSARTATHNKVFLLGPPAHARSRARASRQRPVLAPSRSSRSSALSAISTPAGAEPGFLPRRSPSHRARRARPRHFPAHRLGRALFAPPRRQPLRAGARPGTRRHQRQRALRRRPRAARCRRSAPRCCSFRARPTCTSASPTTRPRCRTCAKAELKPDPEHLGPSRRQSRPTRR